LLVNSNLAFTLYSSSIVPSSFYSSLPVLRASCYPTKSYPPLTTTALSTSYFILPLNYLLSGRSRDLLLGAALARYLSASILQFSFFFFFAFYLTKKFFVLVLFLIL